MVFSSFQFNRSMIYWSLFAFLYLFEALFTDISAKSVPLFSLMDSLPFYYPFKVSLLYAVIGKEIAVSVLLCLSRSCTR